MSAPETNVERQKRRHKPALIGIAAAVIFAGVIFLLNMAFAVDGEGPLDSFLGDDAPLEQGETPS